MTAFIIILFIIILIINDSSKSRKSSGKSRERSYGSTNNTTVRREPQAKNDYVNRTVNDVQRNESFQQPFYRPKVAFIDKVLDAVEQSRTDYDKKVQKEMNLIINEGFKKDSEHVVNELMDSLDKIIPRDVLLSRLTQEWFMGDYMQKCYRCYHIGFCFPFHLPVECPFEVENSYMKTWNEMSDYRKGVHSKICSDYSFLREEKANAIADLFTHAMVEHNNAGIYLGEQYPLYELRQG